MWRVLITLSPGLIKVRSHFVKLLDLVRCLVSSTFLGRAYNFSLYWFLLL